MAVATTAEKAMRKAQDVLDFVNKNSGKTKQFLKDEKLYEPRKLSALERDINSALDELYNRGKVTIRVPDEALPKIFNDGRMKTQFETGTSRGAVQPCVRAYLEHNVLGYGWSTSPKDRPIYGYTGNSGRARQYGENRIVLKKDNKARTTISNDDTMDGSIQRGGTATPISWGNNSLDYLGSDDAIENFLIANGREDTKDHIKSILDGVRNMKGADGKGYIETQIHGGVTPNDFSGILVGDPEKDLNLRKSAADKFGFELRAVDPRDGKSRCFYNCREPAQEKQELLELIERGDFYRR